MSSVKELNSKPLELGLRNKFSFITVDVEILASINQSKVLGSLDNEIDSILDVKNERGRPIHDVIDIALASGAYDQVVKLHAHVYHSFSKVQIFVHLVQTVIYRNLIVFI
jgi:hypothetical protein